jgi:hypothetical protein
MSSFGPLYYYIADFLGSGSPHFWRVICNPLLPPPIPLSTLLLYCFFSNSSIEKI